MVWALSAALGASWHGNTFWVLAFYEGNQKVTGQYQYCNIKQAIEQTITVMNSLTINYNHIANKGIYIEY